MAHLSYQNCLGVNNRKATEDLKSPAPFRPGASLEDLSYEVSKANNCQIDNALMMSRRPGFALFDPRKVHSLWASADETQAFCIFGSDLCAFPSFSAVASGVGPSEMCFQEVNDKIFFTNSAVIGVIKDGAAYTIPQPTDPFRIRLLPGQAMEFFEARLFIAIGDKLYFTDAFKFYQIDPRLNFKQFPAEIDLVAAVPDGLFVAAGDFTYFLEGRDPHKFLRRTIAPYGAKRGSRIYLDASKILGAERQFTIPMWTANEGIVAGYPAGVLKNYTLDKYQMPGATRAAALLRTVSEGYFQYITTLR